MSAPVPGERPRWLRHHRAIAKAAVVGLLWLLVGVMPGARAAGSRSSPANTSPQTEQASSVDEPLVCDGCSPPLQDYGGPVMGTSTRPGEVTIRPIYWSPAGFNFPKTYTQIVNTYIDNVAAASGKNDNVYSTNTEYSLINYRIHAASPLVDSRAFPSGGCTPTTGYQVCVSQDQLLAELASFVTKNKLPTGLAHYYPLFFPSGVQVTARWGSQEEKSGVDFCAYHDSTKTATGKTVVLAVEPYGNICSSGQVPNGDKAADTQVDTLSHEILESIADPVKPYAWRDAAGAENADMCNGNYGPPLGSTDPAHPTTTRYNQVINGAKYYTQTNFSNLSYLVSPFGGCVQNKAQVDSRLLGKPPSASPNTLTLHASTYRMAADGAATSKVTATVVDRNDHPVAGDDVVFRVGSARGTEGSCGTLDPSAGTVGTTNSDGVVTVTYKASANNLACDVVAIEGATGQSDQAMIEQGTLDQTAPTITATLPASVTAGGPAVTFTATVTNPSRFGIRNARVAITITGDKTATQGLTASHLHLSFADPSTNGQYSNVPLIGSTAAGGEITGVLPPNTGSNFRAGATETIKFKLSVDRSAVPSTKTGTALHLTTDFEQVNLASGSTTTLDSSVSSTKVHTA